jgi:hypothetical protein
LLKVHDLKLGAVHSCTFAAKVEAFSGGHDVTKVKTLIAAIMAAGPLFAAPSAHAHCDSLDGPVAKAVQKALETGNVNPVLAYAPATAEAEIRAAFEKSRKVRDLGTDARALADQAFMETVIRLHRAGEGAAYTGLKPAGIDYGPVIQAGEHAVETGDLAKLKAVLMEEIEHALRERLAHVRELQKAPLEPKSAAEVPPARERVTAALGFITFAETIRQAALGKGAEHHID